MLFTSLLHNKIAWYENDGSGAFGPQQVITAAAGGVMSVYAADLDGDGDGDVLSASHEDHEIAWYENLQTLGSSYCAAVINSTGAASIISASGSTSIAANSLALSADNLPAQPGIFIAGPDPDQIPFFNGFLCVGTSGLQRFLAVNVPSGGVITEAVDLSTSVAGGLNAVAGLPYHFQRWNRDPAAGGASANFSDAVAVLYAP